MNDEEKTITLKQVRDALIKTAWNSNAARKIEGPLVAYPNEVLLELFGKDLMHKYWISDSEKK